MMQYQIRFWTFIFIILIPNYSFPQPVLFSSDFPATPGLPYYTVSTNQDTVLVSPGQGGENQTWDFSETQLDTVFTIQNEIVDPNETGFAINFPVANLAVMHIIQLYAVFNFYQLTSDSYTELGLAAEINGSASIITYDTNTPLINFPLHYLDEWITTRSRQLDEYAGLSETFEQIYDGWGTVITPNGLALTNCIRIQSLTTQILYLSASPDSIVAENIAYHWYQAGKIGPVMSIISHQDEANPHFTSASALEFYADQISLEPAVDATDYHFSLYPSYPNPFSLFSVLEFQLTRDTRVSLQIYDSSGRHVRTLIKAKCYSPGRYREIWDGKNKHGLDVSNGKYIYILQTPHKQAAIQATKIQ